MDRDKEKYEKEIIKRKIAGKKGSDARWNNGPDILLCDNKEENGKGIKEMANNSIAIKSIAKNSKGNKQIAKIADTDNVTDTDTVKDNVDVVDIKKHKILFNQKIFDYYEKQTKEKTTATAISSLLVFSFSEDIIKKAIDIAVLRNKTNLDYISGILKSWNSKGFTTLEEISKESKNSTEFDNLYDN